MREQLGGAADVFSVGRMLHQTLDGHRDRLVHLVADDFAREQPLPGYGCRARRALRLVGLGRFRLNWLHFGRHHNLSMRFAQLSTGSKRPRPLTVRWAIMDAPWIARAPSSHAQCSYAPWQIDPVSRAGPWHAPCRSEERR